MNDSVKRLINAGFEPEDAKALRRISMTLRRWYEHECNGNIQRDEQTGKPYWVYTPGSIYGGFSIRPDSLPIADRENGALRRLLKIFKRYPNYNYYVQRDPRGASLYVYDHTMVKADMDAGQYYNRGIAVYK